MKRKTHIRMHLPDLVMLPERDLWFCMMQFYYYY